MTIEPNIPANIHIIKNVRIAHALQNSSELVLPSHNRNSRYALHRLREISGTLKISNHFVGNFVTKLIIITFALKALREWLSGVTSLIATFGAFLILYFLLLWL